MIDELRIMLLTIELSYYWHWGVRLLVLESDAELILDRALLGLTFNTDLKELCIDLLFFRFEISFWKVK